jgi:type I restriction enzyme S subunit
MSEQDLASLCVINPETLRPSTPADFKFRYLDISAVTEGQIDWSATKIFTFAEAPSRARRQLRVGDAILCTVRPGLKAHARIERADSYPLVASTGFAVLRPHLATDAGFIFHQLFGDFVSAQLRARETGSNYPAVNEGDVKRLRFYAPEAEERNRIAVALDIVDQAIANAGAVIAKLRQVRAGMIHDLLTCGIDENGELRDSVAHLEQFQESSAGLIPKAWQNPTLGDAADWFSGGTPSRSERSFWSGEVPLLTPKDMKMLVLSDTSEHITEEAVQGGSRLMPSETVFIVVRGMILARTFPVCLSSRPFAFNQDIKAIRGRAALSNRFLAQWFAANSSMFLRRATEATHGTKKLDTPDLLRVHIGIPRPEEQAMIVERIESLDSDLSNETAIRSKLTQVKSGLISDLLTGRVRVPEAAVSTEVPE